MNLLPETIVMPAQVLVGSGYASRLVPECSGYGSRGVVVHGNSLKKTGALEILLGRTPKGVSVISWEHPGGEPHLSQLVELLKAARKHRARWIAGVGGGSVMDLAKACAGLYNATREPGAYHDGVDIESKGIALAAVPTTAGTGSEATPNAVLTNPETGQKKSIKDNRWIPRLVILDETLLARCPKHVIAHAGMDAFTQAVESCASRGASWFSDTFALKALSLINGSIVNVYDEGAPESRGRLLIGSYFAGIALSAARLGAVHGLAHPLGARYNLPHGLACAILLAPVIEINRGAMAGKYDRMSEAVGDDLLARCRFLLRRLRVESPLAGRPIKDKDEIISEALASPSTAANPRTISAADIDFLLNRIFRPSETTDNPGVAIDAGKPPGEHDHGHRSC